MKKESGVRSSEFSDGNKNRGQQTASVLNTPHGAASSAAPEAKKIKLHIPVMLSEIVDALRPRDGEVYVDGTFGAGGYSRALLEAAQCRVYAIDRDPNVKTLAQELEKQFAGRFVFIAGSFSDMVDLLAEQGVVSVDGIVLDIGVSSMQIDEADRGFSFRQDGPLDMRMEQSGMSAADVVNNFDEVSLANILYQFGEEKASRRIAKAIAIARGTAPITRTAQLADIIRSALGGRHGKTDPATRTFQALRIYVNQELNELEQALAASERLLKAGGRLVVVTFHSLEDRMVKQFLLSRCGETGGVSRHLPMANDSRKENGETLPIFLLEKRSAVKVSKSEASQNPRARSAKLRVAVRAG